MACKIPDAELGNRLQRLIRDGVVAGFGDRLRRARLLTGMSEAALGHCIGRSEAYITVLESGEAVPPALTAHALAEALGVSPDWLAFNLKVQGRARADSARLWQAVRALQEQRASR